MTSAQVARTLPLKHSPVYLNALLASLNGRRTLKEAASIHVQSSSANGIQLSTIHARGNPHLEKGLRAANMNTVCSWSALEV